MAKCTTTYGRGIYSSISKLSTYYSLHKVFLLVESPPGSTGLAVPSSADDYRHLLPLHNRKVADIWQLTFKCSSPATESYLEAQLVRTRQAICQVAGSSPSLSYCHFSPASFTSFNWFSSFLFKNFDHVRSDSQVWSTFNNGGCTLLVVPSSAGQAGPLLPAVSPQ